MSNNRYVILNCPMYFHSNCYGHTGNCDCSDCTGCVMKRIVELCKGNQKLKWQVGQKPEEWISFNNPLSYQILQLLDMQEIE